MPHVLDHPLVQRHLAQLRDVSTPPAEFRLLVRRLATLLACEATRDLPTSPITVQTPLAPCPGVAIAGRIGVVPILRAGLGMVEPVLELIPSAEVWHLGVFRDEATAQPVEYYKKIPAQRPVDVAMILDPMLATGGSALAALKVLADWGVPQVKLLCIIAAEPGVAAVRAAYPQVQIYMAAVDRELNQHKFIVPGLGDAGDRMFHTT